MTMPVLHRAMKNISIAVVLAMFLGSAGMASAENKKSAPAPAKPAAKPAARPATPAPGSRPGGAPGGASRPTTNGPSANHPAGPTANRPTGPSANHPTTTTGGTRPTTTTGTHTTTTTGGTRTTTTTGGGHPAGGPMGGIPTTVRRSRPAHPGDRANTSPRMEALCARVPMAESATCMTPGRAWMCTMG